MSWGLGSVAEHSPSICLTTKISPQHRTDRQTDNPRKVKGRNAADDLPKFIRAESVIKGKARGSSQVGGQLLQFLGMGHQFRLDAL